MKTVENLSMGEVMLVSAQNVKGGKVQLEFAEVIQKEGGRTNVLALLNEGDDRFNQAKARRAWVSIEPSAAEKYMGIDLSGLKGKEEGTEIELNVLSPTLNGKPIHIQINESTSTTRQWDLDNIEKAAKSITTKEGTQYFVKDGKPVFSKATIALEGEVRHSLITDAELVSEEDFLAIAEEYVASVETELATAKAAAPVNA